MSKNPHGQPEGNNPELSAMVLLKPGGKKTTPMAEGNAAVLPPNPSSVARVRQGLGGLGFELGPVVGLTFAISAPQHTFETVFAAKLEMQGGAVVVLGQEEAELSLSNLPKATAKHIAAISFSQAPDFGPGNF